MSSEIKEKTKIVVVVGPTASGKSALAELIVAKHGGVIINADARQIYDGLPMVTAATTPDEHHKLYQFLPLNQTFSFAQYAQLADREIRAARAAGQLPIVVGGTGLYIDALLGEVSAAPQVSSATRARVGALTSAAAVAQLQQLDPVAAAQVDLKNPRRVARALEVFLETGRSFTEFGKGVGAPYDSLFVGLNPGPEIVQKNIRERVMSLWAGGALDEVRRARAAGHGAGAPGMQTIGVPEISAFLDGELTASAAQELLITRTTQYAKRQLTWFKRNKNIVWYTQPDEEGSTIWQLLHDFLHSDSPEH